MRDPEPLVCVVDDDPGIRRALTRLMQLAGLQVKTFPSAQAFLEHPPDDDRPRCLVVDLRMPGQSGLDLQDELGRSGLDIAIVFITGDGDVPSTVHAMKGGAVDFLEKPIDERGLIASVNRALELNRKSRAEARERAEIARRVASLTSRERQVMETVVTGLLNKQIADRLGAAEKTIKVHRGRVMQKMQAESVADLVRMAEKIGIRPR